MCWHCYRSWSAEFRRCCGECSAVSYPVWLNAYGRQLTECKENNGIECPKLWGFVSQVWNSLSLICNVLWSPHLVDVCEDCHCIACITNEGLELCELFCYCFIHHFLPTVWSPTGFAWEWPLVHRGLWSELWGFFLPIGSTLLWTAKRLESIFFWYKTRSCDHKSTPLTSNIVLF